MTVRSQDGTNIAVTVVGTGPPVVFVHGSLAAGRIWQGVANELADQFTCYLMDRRGSGSSGDHPAYSIEREYEDIEAVIASVSEVTGLVGHSFGAICAIGAAIRARVQRLVLYEPPLFAPELPPDYWQAVTNKDHDAVAEVFLRHIAGLGSEQIASVRGGLGWNSIRRSVPSLIREVDTVAQLGSALDAYERLQTPALLLSGTVSPAEYRNVVQKLSHLLSSAQVDHLEGQGHLGVSTAPQVVANRIRAFLRPASQQARVVT